MEARAPKRKARFHGIFLILGNFWGGLFLGKSGKGFRSRRSWRDGSGEAGVILACSGGARGASGSEEEQHKRLGRGCRSSWTRGWARAWRGWRWEARGGEGATGEWQWRFSGAATPSRRDGRWSLRCGGERAGRGLRRAS